MTSQMGGILGYIDLLSELDTEQVEPMAHALDVANVFRDDAARPSLDREAALGNAPHRDGECYLVPAVLGEESDNRLLRTRCHDRSQPPPNWFANSRPARSRRPS